MKKIVLLLTLCLSFIFGYSQYDLSKNIDRQVMVVPQKGMESQTQAFIQRSNAQIVANFEQLGWYVVLLPENLTQDSFVRSSKDLPFIKTIITKNGCEKYFFKNEEPKYPSYQSYKINN